MASDGIGVEIVDENGDACPEGYLGEIAVTGSSVADGYQGGQEGGSSRFVDGRLLTGDAGFVQQGELYVLGRMGESLKLHGRTVYLEDLDLKVAVAAGLERHRVLVVGYLEQGRPGVAVFAEHPPGPWSDEVARMLRVELGPDPALTVVSGERGLIPRTSSGKPRRRHLWHRLRGGWARWTCGHTRDASPDRPSGPVP